jgi:hypothetical protein
MLEAGDCRFPMMDKYNELRLYLKEQVGTFFGYIIKAKKSIIPYENRGS